MTRRFGFSGTGAESSAENRRIGQQTDPFQDVMPKVPQLPKGMSIAHFGHNVMAWGTGDAAADARIKTLSADELRSAGITSEIAEAWRVFYLDVIAETPNNPSARGRARLMAFAKSLLESPSP